MTSHETVVAAEYRFQTELAARLRSASRHTELSDDAAWDMATRFLADAKEHGWHHQSEHTAPPPKPDKSEPPSAEYLEARARLNQREETHE